MLVLRKFQVAVLFLVLIGFSAVAAAEDIHGLDLLCDAELGSISGKGLLDWEKVISDINTIPGLKVHVNGVSDGAFQNASGFMFITNVSGDRNIIPTDVDIEINLYLVEISDLDLVLENLPEEFLIMSY